MSAAPKLSSFMEGFVSHEKTKNKGTFVAFDYVRMTGDANTALVLAQVIHWTARTKVYRDGHFWIAKTYEQWADELGFAKVRTARTAIDSLIELGLIQKSVFRFGITDDDQTVVKTVLHVRLDQDVFEKKIKEVQKAQSESELEEIQIDEKRQSVIDEKRQTAIDEKRQSINRVVTENKKEDIVPTAQPTPEPEIEKPKFDWKGIVKAVNVAIGIYGGEQNHIAHMLLGDSKTEPYQDYNLEVAATPDEITRFGIWFKRKYPDISIRKPSTIQSYFLQFRAESLPKPEIEIVKPTQTPEEAMTRWLPSQDSA